MYTHSEHDVDSMSLMAGHFERYNERLLAFLHARLPEVEGLVEDLAQKTWMIALQAETVTDDALDGCGLPAYLARLARAVARREATPSTADEVEILIGFRGDEPILAAAAPPPPPREPQVGALSYSIAHGDPATWTSDEIEAQQNLAAVEAGAHATAVVTAFPRAEPAALSSAA